MEIVGVILSSAIVATVLSSLVTIYISRLGYKDKYFEKLIDKRLLAHEELYAVVNSLKIAVQDTESEDRRTYHQIFSMDYDNFSRFTAHSSSQNNSFWISDDTKKAAIDLNREFFRCHLLFQETGDLVEVGRQEYREVARIRDQLEKCLLAELPSLHKIEVFLSNKTIETQVAKVDLKKRPSDAES